MKTNYLISIVGPTAIGKTCLSIQLAQHFKTEILSADSRQFYKEMQIGTAVPSEEELKQVKHHLVHHKSITDNYNVGAFEKEALACLNQLYKSLNIVVMVGGSGLYSDAVTHGLDEFPDIESSIRDSLNERLKADGLGSLQSQLKELDPKSYETIALDNPHRVLRALEVSIGTEKPYSSFLKNKAIARDFSTITIGLKAKREVIYDRINRRVDQMIAEGLIEEAKHLIPFQNLNALNTVGYKELFRYFNGEWPLEFAISEIKKNSRRFAKRQMTWYNKSESILWFESDTDKKVIIDSIESKIKEPT